MDAKDLVVVGAGWYGLAMARTYLAIHPSHKVLILDSNSSVGGVWAKERLYPGLNSNTLFGAFEFSDFPMSGDTYGLKTNDHVPGEALNKYLHDFAEKHQLISRTRFNSKVETIEEQSDDTWLLTAKLAGAGSESMSILTKRVVIATGMASEPNMPHFQNDEAFDRPLFHSKELPKYCTIETLQSVKSVAVLGSAKSAWDAVSHFAAAGVPVEWIIRKTGAGPNWMAPCHVTPLKLWLEGLLFTRFITWLSPCTWGDADGYGRIRSWLHGSTPGRWLVSKFFALVQSDIVKSNGYDSHPETKKLKPWYDVFWAGNMLSILNYPFNVFDLVKNGTIKIHVADIEEMSPGLIHLSTGQDIKADLLCCATGWKNRHNIRFLPGGTDKDLGLPHYSVEPDHVELSAKADMEILNRFPVLKAQPSFAREPAPRCGGESNITSNRPFRLFRFVVPPANMAKRNIGFAGMLSPTNAPMTAQAQALWLTAYLGGSMDLSALSQEQIEWETEVATRYCRWRHPTGFSEGCPDFAFDTLPYVDSLLTDLGLKTHRKNRMVAEIFQHYGPKDYRGLIEEWKVANERKKDDSKHTMPTI